MKDTTKDDRTRRRTQRACCRQPFRNRISASRPDLGPPLVDPRNFDSISVAATSIFSGSDLPPSLTCEVSFFDKRAGNSGGHPFTAVPVRDMMRSAQGLQAAFSSAFGPTGTDKTSRCLGRSSGGAGALRGQNYGITPSVMPTRPPLSVGG